MSLAFLQLEEVEGPVLAEDIVMRAGSLEYSQPAVRPPDE